MKKERSLLLAAAAKTTAMIGRQQYLEQIRDAIYTSSNTNQIITIKGRGGLGKTRLTEDILWRAGHPYWREKRPLTPDDIAQESDWSTRGAAVISNLIDMIDIRLHGRDRFIRELRNSFRRADKTGVEFTLYDQAFEEYLLRKAKGAELISVKEVADRASQAFLHDLKQITQEKRLVWVLDTVERLRFVTSNWLIQEDLLKPADIASRTYKWLEEMIQTSHLQNITLILVGRDGPDEGEPFFARVEESAKTAPVPWQIIRINLENFTPEHTQNYFLDLAQQQNENERVRQHFQDLANEKSQRYRVLWLYTGGLPVKLALYAQIVVANRTIPEPLRWTFDKTCTEVGISPNLHTREDIERNQTPALRQLQWQIEENFINLLFRDPTDLDARVLIALLRAPRGLNAAQLHYILDANADTEPADWTPDNQRLEELTFLLETMERAYLIKRRGSWLDLADVLPEDQNQAYSYRLGLQDEIYRLYAEHMGPLAEPLSPEWADVRAAFSEEQMSLYRQNHRDEQEARRVQYDQLHQWATREHELLLAQKQAVIQSEEETLELQIRPDDPRTFYFRELGQVEATRRDNLEEAINLVEIEKRLYRLWMDPERNFNVDYVDLGYDTHKATNQDQDFLSQTEMFVGMQDPARKFFPWTLRPDIEARKETPLQVLERVVEQEDVTRWLKRFVIWKEYMRAIEFANDVEQVIQALPQETQTEKNRWRSVNHTLSKSERLVWRYHAQIYLGQDVSEALTGLQAVISDLHLLGEKTVDQVALNKNGFDERGFQGTAHRPPHPAYPRLRRIISYSYNTLGYGLITLGQIQKAVDCYGRALFFLRGDRGANGHRATVLNNLARALSEQGWHSAAVCEDGLQIRRQMGAEVPLAWSLNTLALIYDDLNQVDEAWLLAAKALAYFRRADEQRGMGLAMLQLARSLRHKARRTRGGFVEQATADRLYTVAEGLLREAQHLPVLSREPLRLIEILIERGCLHRDRLRGNAADLPSRSYRIHYEDSLINFNKAIALANEKGYEQMMIEARVNRAWTYYYYGEWNTALRELENLEIDLPQGYKIVENMAIPVRDTLEQAWVLTQLSKINFLRGRVALAHFQQRQKKIKQIHPTEKARQKRQQMLHDDQEAQEALINATRAYILALAYGELFSPRSPIVGILRQDLYNRVKGFNRRELNDLYIAAQEAETHYPAIYASAQITVFLRHFFGIVFELDK